MEIIGDENKEVRGTKFTFLFQLEQALMFMSKML